MAEHFKFSVTVGSQKLRSVSGVHLTQSLFSHHEFEVALPMRSLAKIDDGEDPFQALQGVIGKDIEITFATATKEDKEGEQHTNIFKGIVTNLHVNGNWWEHGMVTLNGQSTTVLMDGVPTSQAYAGGSSIMSIFEACVSKHLKSKIYTEDHVTMSGELPYTVQYEESDFDFMKRICFEHGEWFYYDGESLCLGRKPQKKAISIKRNRLLSMRYDYALASEVPSLRVRNYMDNEVHDVKPEKVDSKDQMGKFSLKESGNVFTGAAECFIQHPSIGDDDHQIKLDQIKSKENVYNKAQQSSVMAVSADSDVSEIKVGSVISLDGMSHAGEFVVVHVAHHCSDNNIYRNHFRAIPKESNFPADISFSRPNLRSAIAVVKDNNDPKKLGRVRLLFDWSNGVATPWVRMAQPHAGDERGLYFLPEVGDEVMVGFEGGYAEHPYVIGSLFNGEYKFAASHDDQNNVKSIKTRSGNEILFDDRGKMILKNENNSIELHCESDGRVEIITNGDLLFSAEKNITLNAGMNIAINAGKKLEINASDDTKITTEGKTTIESQGDMALNTMGKLEGSASQDMELSAMVNMNIAGAMTKVEGSGTAEMSTSGMLTVKGSLVKIN